MLSYTIWKLLYHCIISNIFGQVEMKYGAGGLKLNILGLFGFNQKNYQSIKKDCLKVSQWLWRMGQFLWLDILFKSIHKINSDIWELEKPLGPNAKRNQVWKFFVTTYRQ